MRLAVLCVAFVIAFPVEAVQKYALAVYHFNIQYVEGGLIGFPDGTTMTPEFNLNDPQVQDLIVTQSLDPLLDMYARHPTWGCDIEMQGYMVDVIMQRHAQTLTTLRALVASGQITVDSFHWSDQFWLAYPRVDMERSHDMVVASFAAAQLPLGPTVFTQEGQFAMGMERFFAERNIRTAVVAGGVMGYSIRDFQAQPLYTLGDSPSVYAVVATGAQDSLVQVIWDYLDDGELAMTNGLDPYVGTDFVYDPTAAAMYEAQLVQEEAAGYQHLSVQNYVNALLAAGEQPQPLPTVLDGVWHHDVYLWMGNVGLEDVLEPGTSSDNACHTLAMQAHRKLTEVENVVASLKTHAFDSQIAQAWQALLLGEGSDGTGQNPYIGERKYSEAHSQSALDMANSILADPRIKPHVLPPAPGPSFSDDPGPFELIYDSTAHRLPHISWQKQKDAQTWNLTVAFDAIPNNPDDPSRFTLDISFPRFIDDLISVGALEEQILRDTPLASIAGSQTALSDGGASTTVITPAVNGLIGLGNNWYVIKRTETVHVAAQLPLGDEVVRFHDDSAVTDAVSWQFIVMQGTQTEALAAATAANIEPEAVRVSACGCNTSVADGGVLAFAVLGLAVRRRRRLTR